MHIFSVLAFPWKGNLEEAWEEGFSPRISKSCAQQEGWRALQCLTVLMLLLVNEIYMSQDM